MVDLDDSAPIEDDEILYRRIPIAQGWYDPANDSKPSPQAFRPRKDDDTGLSLVRDGEYNTIEEAANGPSPYGYYVAILQVDELRKHGLTVVPSPVEGIRGHVELTDLTYANRKTNNAQNIMLKLAEELTSRVEGPFIPEST